MRLEQATVSLTLVVDHGPAQEPPAHLRDLEEVVFPRVHPTGLCTEAFPGEITNSYFTHGAGELSRRIVGWI